MITKAIRYVDNKITEDYNELKRLAEEGHINLADDHIGYNQIHYLYARSFFKDIHINKKDIEAYNYYKEQAKEYWLSKSIYMQAMIALALNRDTDLITPLKILRSLKERALYSEEMGMYWNFDRGWFWYQAPIETQAMMIEAFQEVSQDTMAVNEMKLWLLKQKQTQDWKTTKATVEACYALLLQGSKWLSEEEQPEITIGDIKIDPANLPDVKVEEGTGYFKTSWNGNDIKPEMGTVTVNKNTQGVSWGSLYWQYFEQLDKITMSETPLKLKKQLFMEHNTGKGTAIWSVSDTTQLIPGDLIKVRIELRVDRDMEYVHM
jgi:hypothetical protein